MSYVVLGGGAWIAGRRLAVCCVYNGGMSLIKSTTGVDVYLNFLSCF